MESPSERNFRDNKNNNIWGIKELDIKDKPEHIFATEEIENKHQCKNCKKL